MTGLVQGRPRADGDSGYRRRGTTKGTQCVVLTLGPSPSSHRTPVREGGYSPLQEGSGVERTAYQGGYSKRKSESRRRCPTVTNIE